MPDRSSSESREIFHIAKLALSNVRLLNDFENARKTSEEVRDVVTRRLRSDRISEPFSLLHQAAFLQFGYICLVWLWENARHNDDMTIDEREIANLVADEFDFSNIISTKVGERRIDSARAVLMLMRNAISHGKVRVQENNFVFRDRNKKTENADTSLTLTWEEFGELCEKVLFAVNFSIYPEEN